MIALAAYLALGWSGNISIPAGYYTLPEIAQRLSGQGPRVSCEPEVANRLLFVSIHQKPLAEVEADLSAVLGVRFSRLGDDGEEIDQEIVKRTQARRLLNRLSDYYSEPIHAVMTSCSTLLPNITPATIDAGMDRLGSAQPDDATQTAAHLLLELGNGDLSPLAYVCLSKGVDFDSLMRADEVARGTELDLESLGPSAWRDKFSLRLPVEQNLSSLALTADQRESTIQEICAASYFALRLGFDPYSGRLETRLSLTFHCDSNEGASGEFDVMPDEILLAYPKLAQIGDDQWVGEYASRRATTQAVLSSEAGERKVTTADGSRSLSEFFAGWAAQSNRDVIMEVSPGRDLSPNRFETGRSVSVDPIREVLGSVAECEAEVAEQSPEYEPLASRMAGQALARAIAAEPTYTCRLENEVLCVRDEFGFLDHSYKFPLAAIAALANGRLKTGAAPKLEAIERYCQAVDAEQAGLVARFHCALVPTDVASAWPILRAFFGSASLRRELSGSPTNVVSWRISQVPDFAPATFVKELSGAVEGSDWLCGYRSTAPAVSLDPDLGQALLDSNLEIEPAVDGSTHSLRFSISHRLYLAFPRVGTDGALTHAPEQPKMGPILQWAPVRFTPG